MSNPAIEVHLDAPEPTWKPLTATDLFSKIDERLRAAFPDTVGYIPYFISNTNPSVDDQDKVWIKTDGSGKPLGTYIFYNGAWRVTYSGKLGEVTMFSGDPSTYFDGTGKGLVSNQWDGWALMNGKNGTADVSDRFIAAGHMNNANGVTGFVGGWRSDVTGAPQQTGGANEVKLGPNYIYRPPTDALTVYKWTADSNAPSSSGDLYGVYNASAGTAILIQADDGNTDPFPFAIVPPFYALAYVQFIGY